MATRRPKVPRATPAVRQSKDPDDGAEVIRADFGATRHLPASAEARKPEAPGKSTGGRSGDSVKAGAATGKQATGRPTDGRATSTRAPGSRSASPKAPGKTDGATGKNAGKNAGNNTGENQDPVPAKAFSGRMLALAVVMIAITIMLAPTVKIFIDKRAEIAALEADIAARQAEQANLKLQVSRWQDPNYVKQQARDRINMVMPGETGYWVFGSDLPAGTASGLGGTGTAEDPANLPWVDSLWESIRRSATD
ncbi:septum formation initiator family protein [Arthrobacter sp. ISL-72]|uniref:FtsB family cell division protein n=1 Tax=Arthrobacter sp. ISL-72 TaxID=2819114 RepID=UPI001BECF4D1|nr:septum formation initiator family protein [Arthrobacter sp. ISL-72]MBT2595587.1 septum formation initiator family protein [Arthrobacter sp. ISL-72]